MVLGPSSNKMEHQSGLRFGGSGLFLLLIMQPAFYVASGIFQPNVEYMADIPDPEGNTLNEEVQARWRLVETAWELNINRNLVSVHHDAENHALFVERDNRRVDVTSARNALSGYQKGHCFYCFRPISLARSEFFPDVDHFFPHVLGSHFPHTNFDGVWNLTLSCKNCNRGTDGKFARLGEIQ